MGAWSKLSHENTASSWQQPLGLRGWVSARMIVSFPKQLPRAQCVCAGIIYWLHCISLLQFFSCLTKIQSRPSGYPGFNPLRKSVAPTQARCKLLRNLATWCYFNKFTCYLEDIARFDLNPIISAIFSERNTFYIVCTSHLEICHPTWK